MTDSSSGSSSGSSSRRRRSKTGRRAPRFSLTIFQRRQVRYVLAGIAGALAMLFLAVTVDNFGDDQTMIGLLPLGITKSETHYGFGVPRAVRNGPSEPWQPVTANTQFKDFASWNYALPSGGILQVDFGDGDRVSRLSCGGDVIRGACPLLQSIGLGDYEDAVFAQLGTPTLVSYDGPLKIMHYSEIGLSLTLREFRVERMSIQGRGGSALARMARYLRWAIP